MLTAQAAPGTGTDSTDSFAVEDLWELQRRRGKVKPPAISYAQRGSLKKKCRVRDSAIIMAIRYVMNCGQTVWAGLSIAFSAERFDSWLNFVLYGSSGRTEDVLSGRARMDRMRFGASSNGLGSIRGPGEFYSRSFDAIKSRNLG